MNANEKHTLSLLNEYNKQRESFNDKIRELNIQANECLDRALSLAKEEGFSFEWNFGLDMPPRHYSVGTGYDPERKDLIQMIGDSREELLKMEGYKLVHEQVSKFYSLTDGDSDCQGWEEWNTSSLDC